jgi:ElaB/YqjD/DUF883 family membrane-anchored ribosome-binding protein
VPSSPPPRPLVAIGIAAAIGYVLGRIMHSND